MKTPGSQMGSPAVAGGGREARGGERGESGERRGVRWRSTLKSTAPKRRSRSREGAHSFPKKRYLIMLPSGQNEIYSSLEFIRARKIYWFFPCEITVLDGNFKHNILIFRKNPFHVTNLTFCDL